MSIQDEIEELTDRGIDPLKFSFAELISKLSEIFEKITALKGEPGEPGPQGNPGVDGDKGDTYTLTEKDKKDIASKIKVPIVEKVIEKTEVIKEQPIITNEIKEVAVAETPDQIVKKLESLTGKDRLNWEAIDGLLEQFNLLKERIGASNRFGGMRIPMTIDETPIGAINGSNTVFNLSTNAKQNSEIVRLNGLVMELAEDYTFTGRTITFVTAPQVGSRVRVKYEKF